MENSTIRIVNFTDLPNFKVLFIEPLEEFGVKSIEDLTEVLKDEEKKASMISAVKGLGPKTVQAWENELVNHENPLNDSTGETEDASPVEEIADPSLEATEDAPSEPETVPADETEILSSRPLAERNLYCSMDELKEIERTTIDLLRMNGAKKKGRSESVDYVQKRLIEAGLEVSVNRESGFPTVVATNGEGGIVLWGHLDTERMNGMKKKAQGEILGDIIHGRGAANMKGAVASILLHRQTVDDVGSPILDRANNRCAGQSAWSRVAVYKSIDQEQQRNTAPRTYRDDTGSRPSGICCYQGQNLR